MIYHLINFMYIFSILYLQVSLIQHPWVFWGKIYFLVSYENLINLQVNYILYMCIGQLSDSTKGLPVIVQVKNRLKYDNTIRYSISFAIANNACTRIIK